MYTHTNSHTHTRTFGSIDISKSKPGIGLLTLRHTLPPQAEILDVHLPPPSEQLRGGEVNRDEIKVTGMKALLAQKDQQLEVQGKQAFL